MARSSTQNSVKFCFVQLHHQFYYSFFFCPNKSTSSVRIEIHSMKGHTYIRVDYYDEEFYSRWPTTTTTTITFSIANGGGGGDDNDDGNW